MNVYLLVEFAPNTGKYYRVLAAYKRRATAEMALRHVQQDKPKMYHIIVRELSLQ